MTDAGFGQEMRRLMDERKISLRRLARLVHYDVSHLSRVRNGHKPPSRTLARLVDDALGAGGRLAAIAPSRRRTSVRDGGESPALLDHRHGASMSHAAVDFAAWVERTNVDDVTVAMLDQRARWLSDNHSKVPPRPMLADVLSLHGQVRSFLQGGKQRLGQTRELLRINASVMAHACILLGDLHQDDVAITYGKAAALCAREAGVSPAQALSAQAKTERWRRRYQKSADLARQGYECGPAGPVRTLLASQEANAASLLGDRSRARDALLRAQDAAETSAADDSGVSPWSCPRPRQAIYALSAALHAGDTDGALRAGADAKSAWAAGDPWVYGTWAQVRFGTAIAYVMRGDLHGAAEQVAPGMGLPPELRLATITNYLVALDARLRDTRLRGADLADQLREQIRAFNAAALPPQPALEEQA